MRASVWPPARLPAQGPAPQQDLNKARQENGRKHSAAQLGDSKPLPPGSLCCLSGESEPLKEPIHQHRSPCQRTHTGPVNSAQKPL